MLSLVVNDALEGVDIAQRYPTFYRRLLADPQLRWAFLEALEMLEKDEAGDLDPLPGDLDVDLTFLEEPHPPAAIMETEPSGCWRLSWHRPILYLQSLLVDSLAASRPVYRALTSFLEDDRLTLVDDVVEVDGDEVGVLLEAVRPAGFPDALHLSLLVTAGAVDSLRATVEWGSFRETTLIDSFGRVTFPPLSLTAVLDEVGQAIVAALCLTVEPAVP